MAFNQYHQLREEPAEVLIGRIRNGIVHEEERPTMETLLKLIILRSKDRTLTEFILRVICLSLQHVTFTAGAPTHEELLTLRYWSSENTEDPTSQGAIHPGNVHLNNPGRALDGPSPFRTPFSADRTLPTMHSPSLETFAARPAQALDHLAVRACAFLDRLLTRIPKSIPVNPLSPAFPRDIGDVEARLHAALRGLQKGVDAAKQRRDEAAAAMMVPAWW